MLNSVGLLRRIVGYVRRECENAETWDIAMAEMMVVKFKMSSPDLDRLVSIL